MDSLRIFVLIQLIWLVIAKKAFRAYIYTVSFAKYFYKVEKGITPGLADLERGVNCSYAQSVGLLIWDYPLKHLSSNLRMSSCPKLGYDQIYIGPTISHLAICETGPSIYAPELERCNRSDPNLNDCLRKAITNALPTLAKGIPNVGLRPIDPWYTPKVVMEQYFGPVTVNITLTDMYTKGYSKATIKQVRANLSSYELSISALYPHVTIEGHYKSKAEVFLLPMYGDGGFTMKMTNVNAKITMQGIGEGRGADNFFRIKKLPVTYVPSTLHFNFRNMFNGNKFLEKQANRLMNEYSMEIFRALQPVSEEALGEIFIDAAQSFFSRVPFDSIFPK